MNYPSKLETKDNLPYKTEVTRVHKKQYAPQGSVYLVLKTDTGKNGGYLASKLVPAKGLDSIMQNEDGEETTVQALIFEQMYEDLQVKYKF